MEGSHFLVQACPSTLKIILMSQKHASSSLKSLKNYDFNHQKFWICDLSGTITATNGNIDEKGENIMEFIPQSRMMIFDLLIFNGPFDHILNNNFMKDIYQRIWVKSEHFKERALFLRARMNILMTKDIEIFEKDDSDLGMLRNYSLGDPNPSNSEIVVDGYPKNPVNPNFEKIVKQKLILKSVSFDPIQAAGKVKFDLHQELELLFGYQCSFDESHNFVPELGLQSNSIFANIDLDPSETITKPGIEREIIHFPELDEILQDSNSTEISSNESLSEFDSSDSITNVIDVDIEMPEFEDVVNDDEDQMYILC